MNKIIVKQNQTDEKGIALLSGTKNKHATFLQTINSQQLIHRIIYREEYSN